ncbi:RNA polymerase subunit AC19 [Mitosporidium daphniae]
MNSESSQNASIDPDRVILANYAIAGATAPIELLSVDSEYSMTFCIWQEDHTIGNLLKHLILRNCDIEFCGYSVPHPSESKIHVRIQTNGTITAIAALRRALEDIKNVTQAIRDKFNEQYSVNL